MYVYVYVCMGMNGTQWFQGMHHDFCLWKVKEFSRRLWESFSFGYCVDLKPESDIPLLCGFDSLRNETNETNKPSQTPNEKKLKNKNINNINNPKHQPN